MDERPRRQRNLDRRKHCRQYLCAWHLRQRRALSGRTSVYQWPDLEAHKVYWFRVNQQLPSGDWEASAPQRYILGCGNVAAPAGKIQITGFSDGSGAPATAPEGRIKSCNPSVLIGHMRISGLTEITDVTYMFYQGRTAIARFSSAFDSESSTWTVGAGRPPGGFSEGPYSFEVWSGGDGTWTLSARASITLDCWGKRACTDCAGCLGERLRRHIVTFWLLIATIS